MGLFALVAAAVFGVALLLGASGQTLLLIGFVVAMVLMHAGHGGHGHGQHSPTAADRDEQPHDHTRSR